MALKKFVPNNNNLAIAYYRYSSSAQNEASIDQQRELAQAWAKSNGYELVKEYEDAARSGTNDNRPGYQQMLAEVAKIRPHVLIMWKTDRLARNTVDAKLAKKAIREAGCKIHLIAENMPDIDTPEGAFMDDIMDAMSAFYSNNHRVNVQRGINYNAEHGLYNGHPIYGYGVDKSTKKYVVEPNEAPFVQRMFAEYANGKPMQDIANEMNAQGLRTKRGYKFSVKTLNKMLKNRAYIGEYHESGHVIPGGMPVLVDLATFEKVQAKLALNKRMGSQKAHQIKQDEAPRYWLGGKLFCGECGASMQGVSGTSKTGRKYYYYSCSNQRAKKCTKGSVRKEWLESLVTEVLNSWLNDSENAASIAVDAAKYYNDNYRDTNYLDSLKAKQRDVEAQVRNIVNAIAQGVFSEALSTKLTELENQKKGLADAIDAEEARAALMEDEHSIQTYFDKYFAMDFSDPSMREEVLEYFVDKIYLYDDKLVITSWYSKDKTEITWDMLDGGESDPFVKGEAAEFDCFPFGSIATGLPHQ